jgi:SDR family mycofactocin-dependent oxidoreductase
MTPSLSGKVAFITGAARGQGRSHAVRLAQEGANIIAVDLCDQIGSVPYPMASPEDLEETVALVEQTGGKIVATKADVRDAAALEEAFREGLRQLGRVDIVLANAGIAPFSTERADMTVWSDTLDVNLTGVYNTIRIAEPVMIEQGDGGSIVLISSGAGLANTPDTTSAGLAYAASKTGLLGLMRAYANYLAPHSIRVNSIHPSGVRTPMVVNESFQQFFEAMFDPNAQYNAMPVDMLEPSDITNAIAWLVSDAARYVTGVALPVDAGFFNKR